MMICIQVISNVSFDVNYSLTNYTTIDLYAFEVENMYCNFLGETHNYYCSLSIVVS